VRALPSREVHVWLIPVAAAPTVAAVLDEDEQARAARFHFDPDRTLFTAAHGGVRVVLGLYLDVAPADVRFGSSDLGKPYLVDHPEVSFNLSHSGDLAVVAVAAGREVGVDVERQRPLHRPDGVARRIMTPDELARYEAADSDEKARFLLCVWARKEALVKASGQGVRTSLTTLPCEPGPDGPYTVVDLDVPGYAAALAAFGHDWHPVVTMLDLI
jgi:4'-phosphopantetheinyl transferase